MERLHRGAGRERLGQRVQAAQPTGPGVDVNRLIHKGWVLVTIDVKRHLLQLNILARLGTVHSNFSGRFSKKNKIKKIIIFTVKSLYNTDNGAQLILAL